MQIDPIHDLGGKINLNKENFFNPLRELYPTATEMFCDYIDDYKVTVNWNHLFNPAFLQITKFDTKGPKFHDIPYEMQIGIIMKWLMDTSKSIPEIHLFHEGFGYDQMLDDFQTYIEIAFKLIDNYFKKLNYINN